MKLQRKDAGDRKSEQHPNHPQPKPSSVQSAVGYAHQESVSTAINQRAGIDHQPSQKSSSARNEPSLCTVYRSLYMYFITLLLFIIITIIRRIHGFSDEGRELSLYIKLGIF